MCYAVCEMVDIKDPVLLLEIVAHVVAASPLLSEWFFTNVLHFITINEMC